jgi:hypothetical protein
MVTCPGSYSSGRIVERVREDLLNMDGDSPIGIDAFRAASRPSERNHRN